MKQKSTWTSITLVILAAALWAGSGIFVNGVVTNSDLSPLQLAVIRETLTFILLSGFVLIRKGRFPRIKKQDWLWLGLMGGFGIGFFHLVWNLSVIANGVGIATMLQYNEVVLVTIMAAIFFREKMTRKKAVAVLGCVLGTALVSGSMGVDTVKITQYGLLIGIVSAISHASFSLFNKKLAGDYSADTIMLYAFGFGALVLLPFQFFTPLPTQFSVRALGSLTMLVLGSTLISFSAYTVALKHIPVSTAAVIATIEVPLAAAFGWLLLNEQLGIWQIMGAGIIIGGILLVSVRTKKPDPKQNTS